MSSVTSDVSAARPASTPADVPALLTRLASVTEPRLTWYGPAGQRVELSGRVLVNWVAKTAHLLLDELDAVPGEAVLVDLGPSWRAPAIWLAAWHVGCRVVDTGPGRGHRAGPGPAAATVGADIALVQDGAPVPEGIDRVVVVATAPLARAAETLPPGAVDYAAEVPGQDDALPPPAAARARPWATADVGGRRLLGPRAEPAELLAVWAAGGSVVWHDGLDETMLRQIVEIERVATA